MSIHFKSVNYIYDKGSPYETKALDNINLDISDGAFIGCIGHTGSGKSTLIQLINGLLKPSSGSIFINDTNITQAGIKMSDIRKRVGLVFQYPEYQIFEPSIYADVAYGPRNLKLSEEEIEKRVHYALNAVCIPLDKIKEISPFDLSGGQKRRIAIAGVLAMMPEVLILDEPTAGLDPAGRREILNLIKEEHKRQNRLTILVSHSMEDVAKYVDKILVLDKGKIVYFDTPANVFSQRERLSQMGLDIPEVTKIISDLHAHGIDIARDIFDIDTLSQAIIQHLKR